MRFWRLFSILAALAAGSAVLCGQSTRPEDLHIGSLLVASREFEDPIFGETVIALVRYDKEGAVGLMINRRTDVPISRALKDMSSSSDRSDPVYLGGPVAVSNVLSLLRSSSKIEDTTPIFGDVYLISSQALLDKTLLRGAPANEFRVYFGYCGWAAGQLESEVRRKAWHIFTGSADLVFDAHPQTLWDRLIGRLDQQIAQLRQSSR